MRCVVSCGSTLFPWLVFFFGALLWGSMIHKHTGRWMWQGSVTVVSWNWEKYSCHPNWFQPGQCCCCLCYLGEHLGLGALISYNFKVYLNVLFKSVPYASDVFGCRRKNDRGTLRVSKSYRLSATGNNRFLNTDIWQYINISRDSSRVNVLCADSYRVSVPRPGHRSGA